MIVAAPSIGRIVHYCEGGEVQAALIVQVNSNGSVNLAVWDFAGTQYPRHEVFMNDAEIHSEYTWSWPPKV